jgi:TRAP-type C4-dicarboxylate transport system substrate-binding protein
MRIRGTVLAGAALAAAAFSTPHAEEVLRFGTNVQPMMHMNNAFLVLWTSRINEAGKDQVKIELIYGLNVTNLTNLFDRVYNDVAQMSWGTVNIIGRFPLSDVSALPFAANSAEDASVAFWRLHAAGGLGDEYKDFRPLVIVVFPQAGIHTSKKPIATMEDMKGLKMRIGSKVAGQIVTELGSAPIATATNEMYESVQRGLVDGLYSQWTAFQPFKLHEVTFQHLDAQLGASTAMIFMAEKKYQSLPDGARRALDANTGEAPSREFGKFWDTVQAQGRADVAALPGHTIRTLAPAEATRWRQALETVNVEWAKSVPGGEKTLSMYRAELAKLQAAR